MSEYVRSHEVARQLVAAGDKRIAVVLALKLIESPAKAAALAQFTPREQATVRVREVAADIVIELCRLGYRIGWDSANAAALTVLTEHVPPMPLAYAVETTARYLIDEGLATRE